MEDIYSTQIRVIKESKYWKRLEGIMLLIPTENDNRDLTFKTNRLTHIEDVIEITKMISNKFRLNENLTCLIAALHDIGHLPYAHYAEKLILQNKGFSNLRVGHEENSVLIYKNQVNTPLTEVIDGIKEHRFLGKTHSSLESWAVAYADEFAGFISYIAEGLFLYRKHKRSYFNFNKILQDFRYMPSDIDEWTFFLVSQLSLEGKRIIHKTNVDYLFKTIKKYIKRISKHPKIKAKNLHIKKRINCCFDYKINEGMSPQEVVDEFLLEIQENQMAQFFHKTKFRKF